MIVGLVIALLIGAGALILGSLVWAGLDRPVRLGHLAIGAAVEVLLLVQGIVATVRIVGGARPASVATFLAYAVGGLFVLPIGALWALEERTRWSSVVLAVAAFTVAVIVLRMDIVWNDKA